MDSLYSDEVLSEYFISGMDRVEEESETGDNFFRAKNEYDAVSGKVSDGRGKEEAILSLAI